MSEPVPQRIGDAERDRAAEYLREHMSVGRLTEDEFDERVTAALQARTAADLEPLFTDLPAPKPGQDLTVSGPVWPQYPAVQRPASTLPMPSSTVADALGVGSGVAWAAWIAFCFVFGWEFWWLVFVPVVVSSVAGRQKEELKRREKLWQEQQDGELPPGTQSEPPTS